jgi:GT2 family glycosyltransferase
MQLDSCSYQEPDQYVISIIIVNWNSGQLLEKCVRSLLTHSTECSITIVDNASEDSSLSFASAMDAGLTIFRNERNMGFAAGNNLGWRAAKGNYILFLNPDTECLPGSISCLEQTLESDRSIWAVGGRLIQASGKSGSDPGVRSFPTVRSVAAEAFFLDELWPSNPWSLRMRMENIGRPIDVDQPAAACLMVSRHALERIGGFDETFCPAWFEDVDLCRRIRNHGGRIQYQPGAGFRHHGGYSLNHISRQVFLETFHTNQIRYFRKHFGPQSAARVRRLILTGFFLRIGVSMIHPPVRNMTRVAAAKAFWSATRYLLALREAE